MRIETEDQIMISSKNSISPKDLVIEATTQLFTARDPSVIDRYWSPGYVQHSTVAPDGIEGAHALTSNLPPEFRYELARAIAEGDLVVTHGTYYGFGPQPLVAFDLWRVADGMIAEHWDALMPRFEQTASGHSQTDGPSQVREPGKTQENKALMERFIDTVVTTGQFEKLPQFFDGDAYIQHNPLIRDSVRGMLEDFGKLHNQGKGLVITKRHRTIAEGEFVFTQSEGTAAGKPAVFYELWRVQDGKIAEHWDVWFDQPATLQHNNGLF